MIAMLDPKMFTTFVTGATSGIGEATCRRFVSAGAKVIATGRRADRLEALKAELGEACSIAALDVRDRVAVEKTVAGLPEPFRRINVVVANAGHGIGMQLAQQASIADWEDMVATNINGMLYTVHTLLAGMLQRDEGHIVLLGSIAGDYPLPAGNVYGASKAFVKQFALNLRADVLGELAGSSGFFPAKGFGVFGCLLPDIPALSPTTSTLRSGAKLLKEGATTQPTQPVMCCSRPTIEHVLAFRLPCGRCQL